MQRTTKQNSSPEGTKTVKYRVSFDTVKKDMRKNWSLYLLVLPVLVFYILFSYRPMYGAIIAFKNYTPNLGFAGSPWVGFDHFARFFKGPYFFRLLRNTLLISLYNLILGFPAPIILALMFNEVGNKYFNGVFI